MEVIDNINKERKKTPPHFQRDPCPVSGTVKLTVQAERYNHLVTFHVMYCPTSHNAILTTSCFMVEECGNQGSPPHEMDKISEDRLFPFHYKQSEGAT
ncbi:hypothetical protein ACFX2I_031757 [Malus domestica]